jgi:hypothetical protein
VASGWIELLVMTRLLVVVVDSCKSLPRVAPAMVPRLQGWASLRSSSIPATPARPRSPVRAPPLRGAAVQVRPSDSREGARLIIVVWRLLNVGVVGGGG